MTFRADANWNYPTDIRFGPGRIGEVVDYCHELGIKRPMLVTDPGLAESPIVDNMKTLFEEAVVDLSLFSKIKPNPTGNNVADGVADYKRHSSDGVIAVGGGSALDAGKAIALMVGQERPLWDFEDKDDNWMRVHEDAMAPVIAVPTTAGTGSEVGRASVITDEDAKIKRLIFHPKIVPDIVLADPELTVGLPSHLTAATGMDALSHNLEAFCSPLFHPLAQGVAIEGIRLIKRSLLSAYRDGQSLEARANMLVASTMGATAFQKGLGAMHALAHPLGALYDAHHGLLNAVLMPYVLVENSPKIEDKLTDLGRFLAIEGGATGFIDWVLQLRSDLNIPHALQEIGIDGEQIELIGKMAVEDPSAATNPIQFSTTEYVELFKKALEGG